MLLNQQGFNVEFGDHGKYALDMFTSSQGYYAMVITDSSMTIMGGHQLAKEIRSLNEKIPIILVSSMPPDSINSKLFSKVLDKPPLDRELLYSLVEYYIQSFNDEICSQVK